MASFFTYRLSHFVLQMIYGAQRKTGGPKGQCACVGSGQWGARARHLPHAQSPHQRRTVAEPSCFLKHVRKGRLDHSPKVTRRVGVRTGIWAPGGLVFLVNGAVFAGLAVGSHCRFWQWLEESRATPSKTDLAVLSGELWSYGGTIECLLCAGPCAGGFTCIC